MMTDLIGSLRELEERIQAADAHLSYLYRQRRELVIEILTSQSTIQTDRLVIESCATDGSADPTQCHEISPRAWVGRLWKHIRTGILSW